MPVFFFPVPKSQVPPVLANWEDVIPLMEEPLKNPHQFGLRQSTSRNYWHQYDLDLLCKGLDIGGLEFINSKVVCLCDDELEKAARAIDEVLNRVADGIPDLGSFEDSDIEGLRIPEHKKAIEQAKPEYEININADWGFRAAVGFYSFVKSLQKTIQEAISENHCLLYVQIARLD